MLTIHSDLQWAGGSELEQVIEPLASYICATDRPRATLMSALAALYSAVEETNRAANNHFGIFAENQSL
jgi:hypothetical protein